MVLRVKFHHSTVRIRGDGPHQKVRRYHCSEMLVVKSCVPTSSHKIKSPHGHGNAQLILKLCLWITSSLIVYRISVSLKLTNPSFALAQEKRSSLEPNMLKNAKGVWTTHESWNTASDAKAWAVLPWSTAQTKVSYTRNAMPSKNTNPAILSCPPSVYLTEVSYTRNAIAQNPCCP